MGDDVASGNSLDAPYNLDTLDAFSLLFPDNPPARTGPSGSGDNTPAPCVRAPVISLEHSVYPLALPDSFTAHPSSRKLSGDCFPLTRETRAAHVYVHDGDAVIEYPHTEPAGANKDAGGVAHIFPLQLVRNSSGDLCYISPLSNLAYSRTDAGRSGANKKRTCRLFSSVLGVPDDDFRSMDFIRSEYTCAGAKLCSYAAKSLLSAEHRYCTPELLAERVSQQRHLSPDGGQTIAPSVMNLLLEKTVAFAQSLGQVGCGSQLSAADAESLGLGSEAMVCPGRLLFDYDKDDRPFVRCEYRMRSRPNHRFEQSRVMDTHVPYFEALFNDDNVRAARYEEMQLEEGEGVLSPCTFVACSNVRRKRCPFIHRSKDPAAADALEHGTLDKMECDARFILFTRPPECSMRGPI